MILKQHEHLLLPEGIDETELILVNVPFKKPFSTSNYTWLGKEALLVKISAGELTGWGECVADPDPFYSPETVTSCRFIIKEFILPELKKIKTFGELYDYFDKVRGNKMAKAAVENALLDLAAKQQGLPLYTYLGYKPVRIKSGISIGIKEKSYDVLYEVDEAVEKNYHRVKVKITKGKDIAVIRDIRKHYLILPLMADANGAYFQSEWEHLQKLDRFNLMMIEQPLGYDDIYEHSILQTRITTDLCLDESIHSIADARTAIALNACRVINIKQGRVGGMLEALAIAEYARHHRVPVWSGGMDETGIGRAFNLHLQTHPGFTLPGDTSETARYFNEDIINEPVVLDTEGYISLPNGNGMGVSINLSSLSKFTIAKELVISS